MGRLSTYAKNRILNLRFQKSYRIKQIAQCLLQEDNIKVSRKSISTFLKKYIETKSINDKPRSGRNKKLTPEEINLIGEITRLNRDITAPKIKEYLNLNVSTYTILRASKLFEWNKLNPNSNEAKKAAALERQLNGEVKKKRSASAKANRKKSTEDTITSSEYNSTDENLTNNNENVPVNANLNLISESEIQAAKNASSSAMVFATKVLYKIFNLDELLGHNVSGKTFNRYIKNKKALDEKRIMYIRWLVEKNYDTELKEEQWKACRTAINKSIRNNELKGMSETQQFQLQESQLLKTVNNEDLISTNNLRIISLNEPVDTASLEPNMSLFQMSNDLDVLNKIQLNPVSTDNEDNSDATKANNMTSVITLTSSPDENYLNAFKEESPNNLGILSEAEILELKRLYCSPMIFATRVLLKIFTKEELLGHNVSGKTFHRNLKNKEPLDESRINYIHWLIQNYFASGTPSKQDSVWKSCRKAINRVIRNFEIKESKLIKSIDVEDILDINNNDSTTATTTSKTAISQMLLDI